MCSWSVAFWEANTEECCQHLKDNTFWESIPLLHNLSCDKLVNEQLVRFRGMIQDMYDPEFYLSRYEVVDKTDKCSSMRSGKYRDSIAWEPNEEFIQDSSRNVHSERYTFYCVPIPGINSWVTCFDDKKSCKSETKVLVTDSKKSESSTTDCFEPSTAKRVCFDGSSENPSSEEQLDLNFSIPRQACVVKMYNEEKFSLNEVIEVVGFLSSDNSSLQESSEGAEVMEDDCVEPDLNPGVPRLHCIAVKRLTHCNPLLPAIAEQVADAVFESAESVRQELHMVLSHLLFGDTLAADYVLCHLLSSVYLRNSSMTLGKMSLNVTNIPTDCDYASKLYSVLALLLPKSHFVAMTLENLNKQVFVPKKDYSENKLKSGVLQLSSHTHLVIDETQLMPGQLDSCGVQNVTALGMVMRHQRLDYDFKYYTLEFETDIPVLVLSEGKSLLPSDVVIPLHADNAHIAETFDAATHYLKEPLLGKIRVYLSTMMQATFSVPSSMQQVIEEDFVEMRKENNKFTPDDLHRLLVLARLVSLSKGLREMTTSSWKHAVEMERRRQAR